MGADLLPYLARLNKRPSDAVPSETDAVQTLLDSYGWALLTQLIDDVHGDAVRRLLFSHAGADGKVFEQAEYARLVGFLSGLEQFKYAAEAYIEHAERVRRKEG